MTRLRSLRSRRVRSPEWWRPLGVLCFPDTGPECTERARPRAGSSVTPRQSAPRISHHAPHGRDQCVQSVPKIPYPCLLILGARRLACAPVRRAVSNRHGTASSIGVLDMPGLEHSRSLITTDERKLIGVARRYGSRAPTILRDALDLMIADPNDHPDPGLLAGLRERLCASSASAAETG